MIPRTPPHSVAACWNEIVAHLQRGAAAPVIGGTTPTPSKCTSEKPMTDQNEATVASIGKPARPQWRVGQLWQERKPFRNGLVRIEAITDHPETPVIGRCTRTGLVDCYGLNGAWESDGMFRHIGEVSDGDLVILIEDTCLDPAPDSRIGAVSFAR
jgi:hypothetical protein